jgi:hypothetical protein
MNSLKTILGVTFLATCVALQAQSAATPQRATLAKTPATHTKNQSAKPKTQEEVLLEHLNEKFEKLDQVNEKLEDLQRKYDALQQQMSGRDAELEQARKDAAAAQATAVDVGRKVEITQQAVGPDGSNVTKLQGDVANLEAASSSLVTKVETTQQAMKKLENPETIHLLGVDLKPGGFVAAETVDRQRGIGGDVNTSFASIPFAGQTAGKLSEFNAGGRQSRLSLLAEGKLQSATLRAYYETDFLSSGTTSNDNQSNSYTMRQRQAWGQAELNHGWTLTFGQMWSLATEYKSGLTNTKEATPLTIDAQYNVGFTWERQYGFRVVKRIANNFWFGTAVEESQTLNIGGHNLPTIVYQQTGNGGGLYNSTANYSFNYAPDLIAKIAYEPGFGHFELFGIGRFFRDRAFPNAQLVSGASALGAFTSKTAGGGIGVNARIPLFAKKLDVGAHILVGNGIGRYSTSTLADATAHPNGSLELLTGGSALGSMEWHVSPRFDMYAYYGGEYVKRASYWNGLYVTAAGPTYGQPVLTGYGAPSNIMTGCYTEVLPASSANGGGNVPGSAANCVADNRNIQEGTLGYWFRFYRGPRGTFQQGIQYSHASRHTWQGIGDPTTGLGGSPKAIDNMWFTSFRYYLP